MTDTLKTYFAVEVEHAGSLRSFGNLLTPIVSLGVSITGDAFDVADVITIASGATVSVYNWLQSGGVTGGATPADFEAFVLISDGYLEVYEIIDIPTSTTNLTPTATGEHARQFEMTNTVPYCCSSDQRMTQPTATDFTKITSLTGYSASTGTGTPDLIASATRVTGKVYSIIVYNPGSSAVTVQRLRVN